MLMFHRRRIVVQTLADIPRIFRFEWADRGRGIVLVMVM
jgi:hypothetical protein